MRTSTHLALAAALAWSAGWTAGPAAAQANAPCAGSSNQIKYAMYFLSKPQDAADCTMMVRDGKVVVVSDTTNPGMTCPDMASWKLFVEAVEDRFWRNWSADQYAWPNVQPLPLCQQGSDPATCCNPDSRTNPGYDDAKNPGQSCPYFPGDHLAADETAPLRLGQPPSKAHLVSFAALPQGKRAPGTNSVTADPDPGRKIRQSMAELVFRNKPMVDFIFRNNLYNQEGVIDVYKRNAGNIGSGSPYRVQNRAGALAEIDFPVKSVMIKSNWVAAERAAELGIKENPKYPFVKMEIISPVTDNNGTILLPGVHWLVAFHVSSKDTPNWLWATFEHSENPGRCDYTGCNDSYGYITPDKLADGQADNFTNPLLKCDDLLLSSWIFDTGKTYDGGRSRAGLARVLRDLGIGTRDNTTLIPTPDDRAWLSYRLKGSQTQFTDAVGRRTQLGNSVTEGGFANTSSCITCHARAGATGQGTIPLALGVFENETSEVGYLQSAHGTPNPAWYHKSGQPPALQVLQTDFVWGFLSALCVNPNCSCPNAPASCSAAPAAALTAPKTAPKDRSIRGLTHPPDGQ